MTYDDAGPIRELAARFGLATKESADEKHPSFGQEELVVGRNLDWLSQ